MRPTTSWKKLFRPFEAVPRGTRKQTGLPRETLLDRGPLLLLPDIRKVASLLDEGRTPVSLERGVSVSMVVREWYLRVNVCLRLVLLGQSNHQLDVPLASLHPHEYSIFFLQMQQFFIGAAGWLSRHPREL